MPIKIEIAIHEGRKRPGAAQYPARYHALMEKITKADLIDMIRHWIATPVYGYLGSGYGADLKAMLQTPMSTGIADSVLAKLRVDIPLVASLPASALNIYAVDEGPDKRTIYIDVAGEMIPLGSSE
jgi:hypothetical protein